MLNSVWTVLVRRKLQGGNNQLVEAQILAQNGTTLKVQVKGVRGAFEVDSANVVPRTKIFGGKRNQNTVIQKQYTQSPYALTNQI